MASSSIAEQQQQLPPKEQQQHQQCPCAVTKQSPQPNDLNQQQVTKAPNGPSYEACYASYNQQRQQYNDYSGACPLHQLEASEIHSQGHSGCRGGGGGGRGHDGGINPNTFTPPISLLPTPLSAPKIWCEICRVECNSLEVLAVHKNGKKHRKNIQRYEEMQKQEKVTAEYQTNFMPGNIHTIGHQQANAKPDTKQTIECQQANVMPSMHASGFLAMPTCTMHLNSVINNAPSAAEQEFFLPTPKSITKAEASSSQLEPPKASELACNNVQEDDAIKSHNEELEQKGRIAITEGTAEHPICVEEGGEVAAIERITELPNSVEQNGKVATTDGNVESSKIDNYSKLDVKQGGMKRKISNNNRSGKKLKKSKPEPLRICTVCNVSSESLKSFDAHIAGKKHLSKLRSQELGAVFGPIAVYIPPNQPILIPASRPDPIFYGLGTYQMVGQVVNGSDGAHYGSLQNQDAPSVFAQKEKTELEGNVDNVADCAVQEADSKEIDDKLVNNGIGVCKPMSESKDAVSVETGDATELIALDSELKEKNISEAGDTLKVSEDFALDSTAKERNSIEADDIGRVETALDSGSKENLILEVGDTARVKEDVL